MKTELTPRDITPELRQAVAAYIEARATAQATREFVDKVQRELLTDMVLTDATERSRGRITEPGDVWMAYNDKQFTQYLSELDKRLRATGIKPDDMEADYCPALVAEDGQRKAELVVIDEAAAMLKMGSGEDVNHTLLCQPDGLAKRQEFIDITAKLVLAAQ
jgi:hypothetical protein